MPATPAWPPESAPRLFLDTLLGDAIDVLIDGGQAHYLISVMRLKAGDPVLLFDDRSGEWLAQATAIGKRELTLTIRRQLRERETVPDLWLLAAPIKKARIDWVAEKACELGIALYRPVLTRRTIVDRVNLDRLRAHMIEAAEQCGRTALPALESPIKLTQLLRDWPSERLLYFADESGGEPFVASPGPAAILVGPEGGFDESERAAIRANPAARPISLGPRILRAETAALTAISVWMASAGDWSAKTAPI